MVHNTCEWLRMVANGCKCLQIVPMVLNGSNGSNGYEWFLMVANGSRWFQIVMNGSQLLWMVHNCWEWLQIVANDS